MNSSLIVSILLTTVFGAILNDAEGAVIGSIWGVILWYAVSKVRYAKKQGQELGFMDQVSLGIANEFFTTIFMAAFVLGGGVVGAISLAATFFLLSGTLSWNAAALGFIPGAIWGFKAFAKFKDSHIDSHL